MSELRATPGPWEKSYWIEGSSGRTKPMIAASGIAIAITHPSPACPKPECEANAHLIAVAPELYEALVNLLSDIDGEGEYIGQRPDYAYAALAKARGES